MQHSTDGMTWQGFGRGPAPWLEFENRRLSRQDFRSSTLNGLPVVSTPVELDINNKRQLAQAILAVATDARCVVVDMTGLTYIDASGLGGLMRAYGCLADDGIELRIATTNARARWMMSFFGQDSLLRVFDTLPEAVTAAPVTASQDNVALHRQAA